MSAACRRASPRLGPSDVGACCRFGALTAPLERGAVSPGTYCTRTYEECHRKPCRLQSPNYPGMYPR